MDEIEIFETPFEDCIVCTSVTAEDIYRRQRRENSLPRKILSFFISIFYE